MRKGLGHESFTTRKKQPATDQIDKNQTRPCLDKRRAEESMGFDGTELNDAIHEEHHQWMQIISNWGGAIERQNMKN
jgi:hypothetical protein